MSTTPPADLNTLAQEALTLWQEHLAKLAADPKAKADLATWMEPSRRMLDEWMQKAQSAAHVAAPAPLHEKPSRSAASHGAAPVSTAADDGAVRIAQLALRVAELEVRIAKLEARDRRAAAAPSGYSRDE